MNVIVECPINNSLMPVPYRVIYFLSSTKDVLRNNQVWTVQMLVYRQYWSPWNSV
jgi:hypothetical protein